MNSKIKKLSDGYRESILNKIWDNLSFNEKTKVFKEAGVLEKDETKSNERMHKMCVDNGVFIEK